MKVLLDILRCESADAAPWHQCIPFETADTNATVASALTAINADPSLRDTEGRPVTPIRWECSCLQKKCGACAMRINGVPRLACDAQLADLGETVRLAPLGTFPVVADLMVDRSGMMQQLRDMRLWLETSEPAADPDALAASYEASRCLQCGCCLEVCPNFYVDGDFYGMAAAVPVSRIVAEADEAQMADLRRVYRSHVYDGCGKSLACRDICPAGIDIEGLLVRSNAAAVWKRRRKGRK